MNKKQILYVLIVISIISFNLKGLTVIAAEHVHTDKCYAGHRHSDGLNDTYYLKYEYIDTDPINRGIECKFSIYSEKDNRLLVEILSNRRSNGTTKYIAINYDITGNKIYDCYYVAVSGSNPGNDYRAVIWWQMMQKILLSINGGTTNLQTNYSYTYTGQQIYNLLYGTAQSYQNINWSSNLADSTENAIFSELPEFVSNTFGCSRIHIPYSICNLQLSDGMHNNVIMVPTSRTTYGLGKYRPVDSRLDGFTGFIEYINGSASSSGDSYNRSWYYDYRWVDGYGWARSGQVDYNTGSTSGILLNNPGGILAIYSGMDASKFSADGYYYYPCGKQQDEKPICSLAPTINISNMNGDTILTEGNGNFQLQVKVYDNQNDKQTCKFYLDGSTTPTSTMSVENTKPERIATFPDGINVANLAEGYHTIKVTAQDSVSMVGESSLTFRVDKTGPNISSVDVTNSNGTLKLNVSASDTVAGLASKAYRYTVGNVKTDWLTTSSYTCDGLIANTTYSYVIEVSDSLGHISTRTGKTSTKVEIPSTTATVLNNNSIKLVIKDSNPISTLYLIKVVDKYANASGELSSTENWFTLNYDSTVSGKVLLLPNLLQNTAYSVTVYAKNVDSGEIVEGNSAYATTAPGIPTKLTVNATSSSNISLNWNSEVGVISYELKRETISTEGIVTDTKIIENIINSSYNDMDVLPEHNYRYSIRCKNQYDAYGDWSTPVSVKTLSQPPAQVIGVSAEPIGSTLNVTWNAISGAIGYEVDCTYDGKVITNRVASNSIAINTEKINCQCNVRVRAFNQSTGTDNTDFTLWSNAGEWSETNIFYTEVNTPTLNAIDQKQVTNNSITIEWGTNDNPASVQYKLGIFIDSTLKSEITIDGTNAVDNKILYNVMGLSPETTYIFKLKAMNSNQKESNWSNEVSATTLMDKPAILTGLRATAKNDKIMLFWDSTEGAQCYTVERNGTVIAKNITSTSYIDQDVMNETEYTYRVNAVNATGVGGWSQSLVKKTLGDLPSTPELTVATGSAISMNLSWTKKEGVSGYDIEVDGTINNTGLKTTFEHNGLIPGSSHTYRVRSRNIYGKSAWSDAITIKMTPNAPNIPSNVTMNPTDKQIAIHWDGVSEVTSYEVEVDTVIYKDILASEYLYTAAGDNTAGTKHSVRVRAVNEGGASEWTSTQSVTLSSKDGNTLPVIAIPSTPKLVSSVSGSAIVLISWEQVENATIYQLEADNTIVYAGTNMYYLHTALAENSKHQYRIRAGNLSGYSSWSNPIEILTVSPKSMTPQNITYYRKNDGLTTVLWDNVAEANNYQVEVDGVILDGEVSDAKTDIVTTPGKQYTLRIASVVKEGEKVQHDWSDEITFRAPSKLPESPQNVDIEATTNTVTVNWTKVTGAFGYELSFDDQVINVDNNLTYNIAQLQPSSSHIIKVRTYNDSGESNWSESKTIMTNEGILGVPINITCKPIANVNVTTGAAIQMNWSALKGATSYEIEDSNGKIYTSKTNQIIIENLIPGLNYNFRVRALSNTEIGAWSSKISVISTVTAPTNVVMEILNGYAHLSWNKVNGAEFYEVQLDGVVYTKTDQTSIDFDFNMFYKQRIVKVRACYGTQKSAWSKEIIYEKPLPVTVNVSEGEEFSVLLPVKNAELNKYKLTLVYDANEMELLDACEITPEKELSTTNINKLNTHVIISQEDGLEVITFLVNNDGNANWTGVVSSIKFKSKISGTATIQYGVTKK